MEISSKRSSTALPSSFSEAAPRNVKPQRSATLPLLTPDALKKELQALTVKMERTGALTTELHTLLHRRWLYERSLSSDFNDITFGESRRNKLAEFDGGALVAGQYGMNCAEDENLDYSFLHKLHMGGEFNSFYQRQWASEKFNAQCTKLYTDQGGQADDNVLYFNSPSSAQRFLNHCAADLLEGSAQQHLETQGKLLYPGIYAVKFKAPANAPAPSDDASPTNDFETNPELLQYLGARPSAYQVIRSTLDVDKTQHFDYRNCVPQLKALFGQPAGSGTALLRQIPVQHPCHALAQTTATLVDSLVNHLLANPQLLAQETGGSKPTQRFNPNILADALNTLSAMTQAMPSLTHDSISFADCYRAIAEELMVIMTLCKPYTHKDFKQATEQQMKERLGPEYLAKMPNVPPTFLFSSGMQALSVGLEMAEQRDANQPFTLASDRAGNVETPTYFEVAELLKKTGNHYVADATTYATLNHSTPLQDGHGWGVENLVASLKTQLQQRAGATTPLTLILDSTLEKRGDLSKIATTFASDIASDKLRILLCKSYQKYSNLGLTKTQSGSVALLAANTQDNNKLQAALGSQEQQLGWANNDDSQLLIHLLKHSTGEFNLLEKAAQNAQFVRDELFNGKDGLSPVKAWQPGLPFIVLDCATDKSHQFTMGGSADATVYSHSQGELLSTMDVRARSSFAYLESTQSSYKPDEETGNIMRLTFGMESKAELVERFYMASRLMASSEKSWCCKDASQEIEKILRDSGVFTSPEEMASLSLTQKIAKVASQQRPALATGDSVLQKRLSAQTKNQGGAFVLNKLASVVNQLNWLVDNASYSAQAKLGDNDMKLLGDLLDAFLKNDLPGVSPRAREGILQLNQFLALETIKRGGEQNINQGIQRILNMADKTTSGMLLRITNLSRIPDAVFQQQTPHTRRQLIDKLFLPMDSQTRVLFIQNRLNAGDVHIAQACLHTLKTLLEKGKLQSPDTFLNHEGIVPTAPSLMAEGKHLMMQERVRQQLASLEKLKAEQ